MCVYQKPSGYSHLVHTGMLKLASIALSARGVFSEKSIHMYTHTKQGTSWLSVSEVLRPMVTLPLASDTETPAREQGQLVLYGLNILYNRFTLHDKSL